MGTTAKKTKTLTERLVEIQGRLNVPKNQWNSFGKYAYRNCEDILEAVKPLLTDTGVALTLRDEIVEVAGRVYVKATATVLTDGEASAISTDAFAREPEIKKGMDPMQITGATSSYARKAALCGLFSIDDNKDADSMDNRASEPKKPAATPKTKKVDADVAPQGANPTEQAQPPQEKPKSHKAALMALCRENNVPHQILRTWIKLSFKKAFDDMAPSEQQDCIDIAKSKFPIYVRENHGGTEEEPEDLF